MPECARPGAQGWRVVEHEGARRVASRQCVRVRQRVFCSNQRAHCMCRLCRQRMRLLRERDSAPCSLTVRSGAVVVKYAHLRDWKQEQLLPLPLPPLLLLPCRFQFASPFARHWNCFYGGLPCCLPAIEGIARWVSSAIPCLCCAGSCAAEQRGYISAQLRTCTHVCAPWQWLSNQPVEY